MHDIETLIAQFREALTEQYERGFRDGGAAMRKNLLRALGEEPPAIVRPDRAELAPPPIPPLPDPKAGTLQDMWERLPQKSPIQRAPRGSVGRALGNVLSVDGDGLTVSEIEELVELIDPEISRKSVGNELRRLEGKKYRRDRPGGYKWYLMA